MRVGSEGVSGIELYLLDRSPLHTHKPVGDEAKGNEGRRTEIRRSGVRAGYRGAFSVPSGPFDTHPHASRMREVGVEYS